MIGGRTRKLRVISFQDVSFNIAAGLSLFWLQTRSMWSKILLRALLCESTDWSPL